VNLAFQATRLAFPRLAAESVQRAHLIGIAGAGMQSLAEVMLGQGWRITGSDLAPQNASWLSVAGVTTFAGHRAEHVPKGADLVVYSDAIGPENVERRRAAEIGVRQLSYPAMLGELMARRTGLAIAGTHGKSTTTALAGNILKEAKLAPTVIAGAAPIGCNSGGCYGRGPHVLVEACEYRSNFLHMAPRIAVLLGIEHDHFDCFATFSEVEQAYAGFARRISSDGLILANAGCPTTMRVAKKSGRRVVTFGFGGAADWRAAGLRGFRGRYSFQLTRRGHREAEVKLEIPGVHNVLNALAAAALAGELGVERLAIERGLTQFRGLRRRLETVGSWREIVLIDDYAHHPTEIAAGLKAVRERFPGRRVWCIFQPHQASRTRALLDEFAASLHNADRVAVAEIYRAREAPGENVEITAAHLAERVVAHGRQALNVHGVEEIVARVYAELAPGDVLITMGAGDIRKVSDAFVERLRELRAAG
jgi:UDP-N-acetylmuramate--alanine ligase